MNWMIQYTSPVYSPSKGMIAMANDTAIVFMSTLEFPAGA